MQVVFPYLSYPALIRVRPHCRVVHQHIVLQLSPVLRLLQAGTGAMRKAHARALAAKARVGEPGSAAVEASAAKGIAVASGEGADLIGVEVLVGAQVAALGLSVGGEAALVVGRGDTRPGAEAAKLWRHGIVVGI